MHLTAWMLNWTSTIAPANSSFKVLSFCYKIMQIKMISYIRDWFLAVVVEAEKGLGRAFFLIDNLISIYLIMMLCHQRCLLSLRLLTCPLDRISWICHDNAIFAESVKCLESNLYAALSEMHKTPPRKIKIHQNEEHNKYVSDLLDHTSRKWVMTRRSSSELYKSNAFTSISQ